ncbi:MAG: lysyl endopeptidase, partial [Granulosicoccus sp.]
MKNFTLTMLAVTCTLFTYSQIAQGGEPLNWKQKTTNSEINFVKTNVLDMAIIDAEDAVVDQYKETPFRYGITQVVDFDFFFNASSKTLSNGDKIWSMGIDCPNAKSVNLIFGEYFLPEDAKVYIYSEDRTEYIGAFTSANNKEYGSLAVGLVHSNRVIIEFHEPATVAGQALLNISEITHGYRAVVNKFEVDKGPFGNSGSCNMNTNCPDAGPWQDEKRGVALILNSGSAWCTGSLVNNTNEDETPYFLTAAHCDGNENNWVMYFNHEYLGCANSGSAATNQSISGGTQLASTSPSDAHLVELSSNVPASYNPYFNGWDRSGVAVSTAVGIHHPAGDVKKISFDDDP